MAKVEQHGNQYWFWCPGCKHSHAFTIPPWTFNGDLNSPTFTPSLMCNGHDAAIRCHSIVTAGKINFCVDSCHSLAGQTVEMEESHLW